MAEVENEKKTTIYSPEVFTPEENKKLEEFRALTSDLNLTPEYSSSAELIRWLRARDLNPKKAYEMLKTSLKFREINQLDGILDRESIPEPYMEQMLSGANLGVDREGYPIFLVPIGRQDFLSMVEKYGPDKCLRYHLIFFEKLRKLLQDLSLEQGRPVTQFVQILDMEGYSLRQFYSGEMRETMRRLQSMMDLNYPEILRFCLVINAPKMFSVLWEFCKLICPKKTLEKVEVYGTDKELWKKRIAERFPIKLIPPHWGGTRGVEKGEDDEFCLKDESIWMHKPPPLSFFQASEDTPEVDLTGFKTVTIPPRDSFKIPITVTSPNSAILWKVFVKLYDIGFQIVKDKENEIVPYRKFQSSKIMQEGMIKCESAGVYVIIFDNSYSYIRSKTISYRLQLITESS